MSKSRPDILLAIVIFLMSLFGIVMISSSSIVVAQEQHGSNYYYVGHQLISLVIGLILMIVTYFIDYRYWKKISLTLFLLTLVLLIGVFIPGIGREYGGAHRWIGLGNNVFQPSELVKVTFIIYLASWLERKGKDVSHLVFGFIPFAILMIILGFLIMSEPDLGTLSVIIITAVVTFYVAGARYTHLAIGGVSLLVLLGILIKIAPYRMQRFLVFLNPTEQTTGAAYHINQALIAIGSGGWWGLGFGNSKQKQLYLPQASSDSIFAIIAEELGYLRSTLILGVYVFIAYRGYKIVRFAPDNFSKYLATGITTWIVAQAFINIAAMLGVIPLTGVPLPFISYGGSSIIVTLMAVGILLNISKYSNRERGLK